MNKKAQIQLAGSIVDIFAFIAFVFIIILFFLLFQIKSCVEGSDELAVIKSQAAEQDINIILLNYLRTHVLVDGKEMTVADIVSMVDIEEGRGPRIDAFQEITKQVFETQLSSNFAWSIGVYDDDGSIKGSYVYEPGFNCDPGDKLSNTVTEIPVPKTNGGYTKLVFCI